MIDRQVKKPGRSGERGAALVVAIAIMTILLALALTFYAISRNEVNIADNLAHQVQNDLHLDGVLAKVQSELNRNFLKYPDATSYDQTPFTIYDGSWAVGKEWALWNGVPLQGQDTDGDLLPDVPGVPLVDLRNMPNITFTLDGVIEKLFSGPRSKDWLAIPRYEGAVPYAYGSVVPDVGFNIFDLSQDENPAGEGVRPPFVTPAFYGPSETRAQLLGLDPLLEGEVERYPLEWIDTWTDVDNDGDKLKDAIWIPIAQQRLFSGGDIVDEVTNRRMFADGIDNDLDGLIDENQEDIGNDFDGDGVPSESDPDEQNRQIEIGSFVYYGGDDGLDNDGDGLIDAADADEAFVPPYYGLFLAASLPNLEIPIDLNADGKVPDFVPDDANAGIMTMLTVTLPPTISVNIRSVRTDPTSPIITVDLDDTRVDALDNDYDMMIDNFHVYAYVGPNTLANALDPPFQFQGVEDTGELYPPGDPLAGQRVYQAIENASAVNSNESLFTTAKLKSYDWIRPAAYPAGLTVYPENSTFYSEFAGGTLTYDFATNLEIPDVLRITHSGEPVSDLTGRAAITIRDEASKVNMNIAGGHNYNPLGDDVFRSLGGGATTAELETRNLPGVGVGPLPREGYAYDFWSLRTGTPADFAVAADFDADAALPGYGRVDDNANALISSFNRKDDDGDGLIDEGLYLPPISAMTERFLAGTSLPGDDIAAAATELNNTRYREYFNQLGAFEGVDEPGELQRFNPLPNLVAEGNNPFNVSGVVDYLDNDFDDVFNERGELGDLQLQDSLQLITAGEPTNFAGPDITDPSNRYGRIRQNLGTFSTDRNVNFVSGRDGIRAINKLDYNFATPVQLAGNLLLANPFESVTARTPQFPDATTRAFAEGLRQGDVHIRANFGGLLNGTVGNFAADPVLQVMQAAVDIVDNRDRDHIRSVLTSEKTRITPPPTSPTPPYNPIYDYFPYNLTMRERIEDGALMPLGELQDHLRDQMALTRKLEIRDDWWTFEAGVTGVNGNPEVREISYTASGNEAIKINEIMVRAVRRIEAEAVVRAPLATDPMAEVPPLAPLSNFDPTPFDVGGSPSILPQFDVDRETAPTGITDGWVLTDGGFLGETSAMSITLDTTDPVSITDATDILEFTVRTEQGLPPGRYYLTLNTNDVTGVPTVVPQGAGNPEMLQVAVKYANTTIGGQPGDTIIDDIANGVIPDPFQAVPDAQVAGNIPGAPGGWVFINGTQSGAGNAFGYHLDGLPAPDDNAPNNGQQTFTITVPSDTSDFELRIAIRLNPAYVTNLIATPGPPVTVSINSLDFSQEPDHEWLEVVNTSNETVNIGGWEMEVGVPDRPSVPVDPFKSTWTIPQGTQIAPGGMVLLAFSKFDAFWDTVPAAHRIADNGMGLADGASNSIPALGNLLSNRLTLPTIFDNSDTTTILGGPGANNLYDETGSVFRRLAHPISGLTDYMDADGDGRTAYNAPTATAANAFVDNLANDVLIASSSELGTLVTSARGDLPWDRIIQLEPTSIVTRKFPFTAAPETQRLLEIDTVEDVAAFVLRGGVFPNYPEQDGYDNDGDGGYVMFEQRNQRNQGDPSIPGYIVGTLIAPPGSDPYDDWIDASKVPGVPYVYIPGTLDLDMLDNDLDGYVDERPYQGDPYTIGVESSFYRAYLSEGVDEGGGLYGNVAAFRRYGAGSYEAGTLPLAIFQSRLDWNAAFPDVTPLTPNPPLSVTTLESTNENLQYAINTGFSVFTNFYQGSDGDPADWKAFSERRFYPGDNVIVTLYKGLAINGEVVDRVTYNQYDVINRTIDDVVSVPYAAVDLGDIGTAIGDDPYELPGINPDYPSMWLPNTMGLDFYRSLERKHAFHNGDRFGTTNRWEATDGNYDDWSDSISLFEDEIATDTVPGGTTPLRIAASRAGNIRPRFHDAHPAFPANPNAFRNRQIFEHAVSGSPLRLNTAARRGANPPDLELFAAGFADARQFPNIPGFIGPFNHFRTHEMDDYTANPVPSLTDQRWNLSRMVVANAPYQNPGDLMRVPHMTYLHDAINTAGAPGVGYLRDMTAINYGLRGDLPPANLLSYMQDIALRGATLGQDTVDGGSPNVLTAAASSMAQDSLVLTMGQAEFRPIIPLSADVAADPDLMNWITNTAGGSGLDDLLAPAAWAPVFLFNLDSDGPRANLDHFPNYPSYVNGSNANTEFEANYLFNGDYLGATGNFGGVDVYDNDMEERWPLETRTAMYVTESRGGDAAEALFVWDSADGLENGEYIVYIGTYVPGMREQMEDAAASAARVVDSPAPLNMVEKNLPSLLSPDGPRGFTSLTLEDLSTLTFQDGNPVPVSRVTNSILGRDPSNERRVNRHFQPVLALDVITDPSEARGQAPPVGAGTSTKPPGLIDPADWEPATQYRPGTDGYIFYGNNAAGGWKPQIVRVTDNFLALRVRNVGEPGQVAALTHVVLAPRKRTAGRVNVNTAQSRVADVGTRQDYFSALLSLPGVVDVAQTIQPSNPNFAILAPPILPLDEIDLRDAPEPTQNPLTGLYPWTPPEPRVLSSIPTAFYDDTFRTPPLRNRFTGDLLNPDNDLLVVDGPYANEEEHEIGAFRLNAMLMGGRTEHADGRYYTSVGALAADTSAFDYIHNSGRADIPNLNGGYTDGVEDFAIYPLSNESDPAKRFDEVKARFSRMGNLVTTRSDVFEIIMTVETGYGVDANQDGFLNYRDPDEFVTRASTKATAVYERRAPSDTSDGAE